MEKKIKHSRLLELIFLMGKDQIQFGYEAYPNFKLVVTEDNGQTIHPDSKKINEEFSKYFKSKIWLDSYFEKQ
jgi:hypothetical protein